MAPFFRSVLLRNDLLGCDYFEPFAGGGLRAGLELLGEGLIQKVHINDLDPAVACFWQHAIHSTEDFVSRINSVELSVNEWRRQKAIFDRGNTSRAFDFAFATFYLNRTSRSGLLRNAGPIGGFDQSGNYKINARFTRDALIGRFRALGEYRESIVVSELDAVRFLSTKLPFGKLRSSTFAYIDPPYFVAGSRLYRNSFQRRDHETLEKYLRNQKSLQWIVTYDNAAEIREIYANHTIFDYELRYSLAKKQIAKEVLIGSPSLGMPAELRFRGRTMTLKASN